MSMKAHAIEAVGTALAVGFFGVASIIQASGAQTFLFFVAGSVAGAVLGAIGAKKLALLDMGMETVWTKIAAHLCVVIWLGPFVLGWALDRWKGEFEPEAIASAAGGAVALFGTSLLVMVVPLVVSWIRFLLSKRLPTPPAKETDSTPGQ